MNNYSLVEFQPFHCSMPIHRLLRSFILRCLSDTVPIIRPTYLNSLSFTYCVLQQSKLDLSLLDLEKYEAQLLLSVKAEIDKLYNGYQTDHVDHTVL